MSQRGFSLLELMITITILALVLMVGVPSVSVWLANLNVRNTASMLNDGLQQARAEAIRRNDSVSFWLVSSTDPAVLDNSCVLSDTSGSWVISVDSPVSKCASAASTTVSPRIVATHPVADGGANVTVAAVRADGTTAANQVTFNGFGRVTNANPIAQIAVSKNASTRSFRVVVTTAGSARVCEPSVTTTGDPRKC